MEKLLKSCMAVIIQGCGWKELRHFHKLRVFQLPEGKQERSSLFLELDALPFPGKRLKASNLTLEGTFETGSWRRFKVSLCGRCFDIIFKRTIMKNQKV